MICNDSEFFTKEILEDLITATGIGFWVWDFKKDTLNLSDEFFNIVGYDAGDIVGSFDQWNQIIHPEDQSMAMDTLKKYQCGQSSNYLSEFRIVKKNGQTIWVQERGQYIKFDEDGKPLQMAAIIQNITLRKVMEQRLRDNQRKLKLAMSLSGLGVWEWDIAKDRVVYSEEYANQLGYTPEDLDGSTDHWEKIIHPDDYPTMRQNLAQFTSGKSPFYRMNLRFRKADGSYIWMKDTCDAVSVDEEGKPTKAIGGCLDIDELEQARLQVAEYQNDLEEKILHRTAALTRQDTLLMEITKISQKLMTTPKGENYEKVVFQCMDEISGVSEGSRLAIFRNKTVNGKPCCYLASFHSKLRKVYRRHFTQDEVKEIFQDVDVPFVSHGKFSEETKEDFFQNLFHAIEKTNYDNISYEIALPTFYKALQENTVLNTKAVDLHPNEYIFMKLQDIKSVMASPITINNEPWGFIVMDSNEERLFTEEEEKMLSLAGSVFAQGLHQNETEMAAIEAVEHGKLMLDATPLCCNLWLSDGSNIDCSTESVRLFQLKNKQEYLDRFDELSPEVQPCGKNSMVKAKEMIMIAREMGYHRFEWVHQKLDKEPIPCEITLVRIPYQNDFAVAGYTRDLREEKAMLAEIEKNQEHLRQAHEEAVLSSKAKSNFLANMSHEIRTPMNAISGMTDIILRETEKTEVEEYAHNIKRACDSLLSIINDVLDISKIESGKLDIVEGEYLLSNILTDVINIANARLELKDLMFVTNFQQDLPDRLIGDEVRVKQVMVNILNNAIKFTPSGHIALDVSGSYGDGEVKLTISVTDTGSGISEEDMNKLFIEFERVNTTKNRTIEGTGLGLAISKRLCEMMSGTISVESTIGEGSTFTITLIQKYTEYQSMASVEKNKSVLIFEARDIYRNSLQKSCDALSVDSLSCSLQSELNEALNERKFDYIFTSCMYLAKVEEMVEKMNLSSKIVLLADTAEIKSKYDYLSLIMPTHTLNIANLLNEKVFASDKSEVMAPFTAPSCHVLVVDDNLVNLKVAIGLMKPYAFQITTAENGAEAVELVKTNHFDMVFMDHMMPVMDGIDATIAIRKMEEYQNLPIVALTANAIIGTQEMFIKEGMNDFLAKPIKLSTLHEIIRKWLPKEKQISGGDEQIAAAEEQEILIPNVDTKLGIQRVGGDFDTYLDILSMYYKDGLKRSSSILTFYKEKKQLEYKIEVHALKSASASLGALEISEQARALEESSSQGDWVYLDKHTAEFLENFSLVLEDIRNALTKFHKEEDDSEKAQGEDSEFASTLTSLVEALDCVDINLCDSLLAHLAEFHWSEAQQEHLNTVKDFISGYEYDEATEYINELGL
ncbi:MAG: PAS domain-containing protein [Eubacteriales bacterium]